MLRALFFFIMNLSVAFGYYTQNTCEPHTTSDSCIDQWPCMWCNKTYIDNTTEYNVSSCNAVYPCYYDSEQYSHCEYTHSKRYMKTCYTLSLLFYMLLVVSFYISVLVIYGRVNLFLIEGNVDDYTRKSINGIVFFIIFIPLIITFIVKPYIFNILYLSYILVAIITYCCFALKKDEEVPEYTRLNSESNYKAIH